MTGERDSDEDGYPDESEVPSMGQPGEVDRDEAERADRQRRAVERGRAWPFPLS